MIRLPCWESNFRFGGGGVPGEQMTAETRGSGCGCIPVDQTIEAVRTGVVGTSELGVAGCSSVFWLSMLMTPTFCR